MNGEKIIKNNEQTLTDVGVAGFAVIMSKNRNKLVNTKKHNNGIPIYAPPDNLYICDKQLIKQLNDTPKIVIKNIVPHT